MAVPLMVCGLSPLDDCGIEFKIRQRVEFRALYGFLSSFVCVCVCVCKLACVCLFFAGPGPLPSRKTKYLRRRLGTPLNVRPSKCVGVHRRPMDVRLLLHMIMNFSDSFAMCDIYVTRGIIM